VANLNTELLDAGVRQSVYIERYGTSVYNDMLKLLRSSESLAREVFDERISAILELGYDQGPRTTARTNRLISELGAAIQDVRYDNTFQQLELDLLGAFDEFADYENEFQLKTHNSATATALSGTPFQIKFDGVSIEQVLGVALSKPFSVSVNGGTATIGDWISGIPSSERRRIEETVSNGVVNGNTTRDIVRNVFGTVKEQKSGDGNGAIIKTRRGVDSFVRTAINHISSVTREELYKKNKDMLKGVRWISTLDSRTTPICQSRDNNLYPINEGPRPPAHIACRSVTSVEVKTFRDLGIDIEEPENSTRAYLAIPEKMNVTQYRRKLAKDGITKAQQDKIIKSLSGQTQDQDFSTFLSRQTKEFQETVLGVERTRLYREKSLSLKQLIAPNDKYYTISELKELHPDAFN